MKIKSNIYTKFQWFLVYICEHIACRYMHTVATLKLEHSNGDITSSNNQIGRMLPHLSIHSRTCCTFRSVADTTNRSWSLESKPSSLPSSFFSLCHSSRRGYQTHRQTQNQKQLLGKCPMGKTRADKRKANETSREHCQLIFQYRKEIIAHVPFQCTKHKFTVLVLGPRHSSCENVHSQKLDGDTSLIDLLTHQSVSKSDC